ncbi:MAG TPA: hypothetical protein PK542_00330 [Treponemataceae bacterium]|nr:hypothetical protein [Treponemataceae bacterium]
MISDTTVLTGGLLEEFLDRLEADLEETGSPEKIDLSGRLRKQALRADSLRSIARLCSLWLRAGDTKAAWATIDADGDALLGAADPSEKASLAMRLADFRLQIASSVNDEESCLSALERMKSLVPQLGAELSDYREMSQLDSLERCGLRLALAAIDLRRAIDEASPDREGLRSWDAAAFHERRARAFRQAENAAEAVAEAAAAVDALKSADSGEAIGEDDWLAFGDALIELIPQALESFRAPVAELTKGYPLPQRREYEVRLERLKARALRAQGDLAGALKACDKARYSLSADGGDDFVEYEVPWLIEAGRSDEAGRRAFFHIYQCGSGMRATVGRAVHERLATAGDASYWWPACLLRAGTDTTALRRLVSLAPAPFERVAALSGAHEALFGSLAKIPEDQRYAPTQAEIDGDEECLDSPEWTGALDGIFLAARKLCEERDPGNPWTVRLSAYAEEEAGRIDAKARCAQLLQAIETGQMRDNRSAYAEFFARADQGGILFALRQPAPTMPSGLWCYNFVCDSEDEIAERVEKLGGDERKEAEALHLAQKREVYERGIACMERYFETGEGHPYDACAHLYSMMCNNLASVYFDYGRYDESIDLHRRGIEACPFAEHYDGVFMDRWYQEDDEGIVKSAEDLWQYASAYGYGRHNPNKYVPIAIRALEHLDRHDDKTIWLERLMQWQRDAGETEGDLSEASLEARVEISVSLGASFPEESKALWNGIEAQVRASGNAELVLNAGSGAYNRGEYELAIELYAESMKRNPRESDEDLRHFTFAKETTEKAKQKIAEAGKSQKRGWQFWK